MRVETERMYLYPLSDEEMRLVIEKESDPEMKQAYTEMLEGCLSNPDKRIWYAIWNMELKNDPETIAGDFCLDRKSTRLNSSHGIGSRMPSSA